MPKYKANLRLSLSKNINPVQTKISTFILSLPTVSSLHIKPLLAGSKKYDRWQHKKVSYRYND